MSLKAECIKIMFEIYQSNKMKIEKFEIKLKIEFIQNLKTANYQM